jgi:hypothetical protein
MIRLEKIVGWWSTTSLKVCWGIHLLNLVYFPGRTEEDHEERAISVIRPVSEPRIFRLRRTYSPYSNAKSGRKLIFSTNHGLFVSRSQNCEKRLLAYSGLAENLSREVKFHSNLTGITGTIHEDQHTFVIIFAHFFLEWKMIQAKAVGENKRTHVW